MVSKAAQRNFGSEDKTTSAATSPQDPFGRTMTNIRVLVYHGSTLARREIELRLKSMRAPSLTMTIALYVNNFNDKDNVFGSTSE